MDPSASAMYQQHDWSPQLWGLLFGLMIVLVGTAVLVAFAVMMRLDARSAGSTGPDGPAPAELPSGDDQAEKPRPLAGVH